ncbi:MAG: flagellar hook-length control protein FliK [Proteobacteria bacterium]|nr:flagellar hook-length control protein FliK [Pseudomonadota bacterium]
MTSPLPAQHSKTALAESKNSQQGGFLNFCASPKSTETPSFESLISQNDQRQERKDELEEAEAAKKRKKAVDAAAVAAQVTNSGNIQSEACLDLSQDPLQLQNAESAKLMEQDKLSNQLLNPQDQADISTNLEKVGVSKIDPSDSTKDLSKTDSIEAKTQKEEEAPRAAENASSKSVEDKDTDFQQMIISESEDSNDSTSGMKTAVNEDEMVSLATFEDIQASAAPKAASEPSITSTNRLSAMAGLSERGAISSTENSGSSANTSSGNFSAGNPAIIPINGKVAFDKTAASQASSLLKSLAPEIEKFQQTGQSQIQLDLPVGENESVKIRLSLRAGEIRSTFITESPELREALQKAWPDFTATHRAQGVRFGESQFQDSFARNQDAASEQGRQRQYQQDSANLTDSSSQGSVKNRNPAIKPTPSPLTTRSGSINLWA